MARRAGGLACQPRPSSLIDRVVEFRGEAAERLLLRTCEAGWEDRVVAVLWRTSPEKLSPGLFDAYTAIDTAGRAGIAGLRGLEIRGQGGP